VGPAAAGNLCDLSNGFYGVFWAVFHRDWWRIANLLSGLLAFTGEKGPGFFSLVVAGLNCLQFPFGTVLGVFTFVVLLRELRP